MLRINELKLPVNHTQEELENKIAKKLNTDCQYTYTIARRSVDARKKPVIFFSYIIDIESKDENRILKRASKDVIKTEHVEYKFDYKIENIADEQRPVVIGMGPAGLFASLYLARAGFRPIVLERGECIEERTQTVEKFWKGSKLDPNSNVQFGEGGAGAFSDGKLNTQVKDKSGRNHAVLKDFVQYGAPSDILYDHMPHVGTDKLVDVVKNISKEIRELGGEIHYNCLVNEFSLDENGHIVIKTKDGVEFRKRSVILAIGHSSRDTFYKLNDIKVPMEQKAFAVGLRVEHPATVINKSQYGTENSDILGNAPYKVTYKCADGRGVYSFCMCPGGYVVNASSEEGMLAVNGMSYYKRDAVNSNSAIIVTINPSDYASDDNPMRGVEFQRRLEKKAFSIGCGKIPVETFKEFSDGKIDDCIDDSKLRPCIKGEWVRANVHEILPEFITNDIIEGINHFDNIIKGFGDDYAILSGVESRTSSPVKILRDDDCRSSISGLYPAGEGAGYAGGITSAAMDGIKVAECVAKDILNMEKAIK